MKLVIGSAFRNATGYLTRYFAQVEALRTLMLPWDVRVVAAEGDSKDATRSALQQHKDVELVECRHGGPEFGSTEAPERLAALSAVGNAIFSAVRKDDDALFYVESDLMWEPRTAKQLVLHAMQRSLGFDIFAPFVMAGEAFYDTWGFRRGGERFSPFPPYHRALGEDPVARVDSAGSCLTMRGDVARRVRIRNSYGLVGWCEDARISHGFKIGVVPALRVRQA